MWRRGCDSSYPSPTCGATAAATYAHSGGKRISESVLHIDGEYTTEFRDAVYYGHGDGDVENFAAQEGLDCCFGR